MAENTKIQWTESTWNPVTGCTKVSPGCKNCYAKPITERFGQVFEKIELHPERLEKPLHWKKPRRIFVNSMSDLFHKDVPDEFIDKVFAVAAFSDQHKYQILTKRANRMLDYVTNLGNSQGYDRLQAAASSLGFTLRYERIPLVPWPIPSIWLGVSVEDQQRADERIPLLLKTPAIVRFLSCEPLLEPVDIIGPMPSEDRVAIMRGHPAEFDWCIIGGESGPGALACDVAWIRSIVEQCRDAEVAVFVKQLGARPYDGDAMAKVPGANVKRTMDEAKSPEVLAVLERTLRAGSLSLRDRKGGDPDEWPEDLRIREFPREAVSL